VTDPVALVDGYLQSAEDRDLESAARMLADPARIEFPGGRTFTSLADLVAEPKPYEWVRKHRDRYIVGADGDHTVVTSIGRLYGVGLDGQAFEDVRYVDVFWIKDDVIVQQLVWNDLSHAGIRLP
jgi:hypothetical protein